MKHYVLLLFLAPTVLFAGDSGKTRVIEDGRTRRKNREVHDVTAVAFTIKDDVLEVEVRFARTLDEMMFQAIDLNLDCDADEATGIGGADLWIRASLGSRFHPNSHRPGEGRDPPLSRLRSAYATVQTYRTGEEGKEAKTWLWRKTLSRPRIAGKSFTFSLPVGLIRDAGYRYNKQVPVKLRVEGGASEGPIPLLHVATDEGVGITIDGKPGDWSGGTRTADPPGELHPDAAALDITRVQVDHASSRLLVGVWLEEPGYGAPPVPDDDILDRDRIQIAVEPLGGDYLGFRQYTFYTASPNRKLPAYESVAGEGFFEVRIERPNEQNAFRVIVWSDAARVDSVPDEGWFDLDLKAMGR